MAGRTDFDYYDAHYRHANLSFDIERYRQIILHEHRDILCKDKRVLDVGCGAGFLLKVLEMEGYEHLWGVESDEHQFREARRYLDRASLAHQDAFEFLARVKQRFDVIFLYDLIEHIEKAAVVPLLRLARESLEQSGALIIKTPNADCPFFMGRMRYVDFTHELMFNKESIKMVLRQAGFEEIACRRTRFPPGSTRLVRWVLAAVAELGPRLYALAHFGPVALRWILTPNFIAVARK